MRKVAVFFGGKSCENEISILTGIFVAKLLSEVYEIVPIYIHTDGCAYTGENALQLDTFKGKGVACLQRVFLENARAYALLKQGKKVKYLCKIDAVINCCHGGFGEGGGVAAIAQWNDIPLASPDMTSSGIFLDKCLSKVVLKGLGIPTLPYIRVNEKDYQKRGAFLLKTIETRLKFPVIVKPAHLGSSIGICVAKDEIEAKKAIESALEIDNRVLIEKYLPQKQDINCAAYEQNGEIILSEPEPAFGDGVYSFEEKYIKRKTDKIGENTQKDGGRYALKKEIRDKIRAFTKTVYKRMDLRGVVRVDYLLSGDEIYLCEVNTVPGSLGYYLFCDRVSDAKRLFCALIEEAISTQKQQKKLLTTGILQTVTMPRK